MNVESIISQFDESKLIESMIAGLNDVQSIGTDTVNGVPTRVYQYKTQYTVSESQISATTKVLVGVAVGLPHKQEIAAEALGGQIKLTQVIRYNPKIKIKAPIR